MLFALRKANKFALYCTVAGCMAFVVSVALGGLVDLTVYAFAAHPDLVPQRNLDPTDPGLIVSAVVLAPLIETVVYRWLLQFLTKFARLKLALFLACLLAGIAHGPYLSTFAATSGAFFVYALAWHQWRSGGAERSYWAPALAHSVANSLLLGVGFAAA